MVSEKRRFCIEISEQVMEQIRHRASIHNRTANQEITYLIEYALSQLYGKDPIVNIPGGKVRRTNFYLPGNLLDLARNQATQNHRSLGKELTRLLVWSLEAMTQRDLALIEQMVAAG